MPQSHQIRHNIAVHDALAPGYDDLHGDIFNPVEQDRLRRGLGMAIGAVRTDNRPKRALDFGCGSGNLTRCFIELGLHAVSADVAPRFLELIGARHGHTGLSKTLLLNGEDLSNVDEETFDIAAAYSVLHHIPDYLAAVRELVRVTQRGGVIYLDHEHNADYWNRSKDYQTFVRLVKEQGPHRRRPPWIQRKIRRLRRIFNPRYMPEGDIHVWPDDHIEWAEIERMFTELDCEMIGIEDYLLYMGHYPPALYDQYRDRCSDMRMMTVRRR
jgi:ubiquinone/menaquinone biosynthesis C-methylase UbiE